MLEKVITVLIGLCGFALTLTGLFMCNVLTIMMGAITVAYSVFSLIYVK